MRQAGRYLPEYKKIRAECDSFLSLCYNPKKASEVTLQPLQRFDLDGAILFSDILVVADGMGCPPVFDEKRGPVFTPIREASAIKALVPPLADDPKFLQVAEAAERVASRLAPEKTLLGFCGSPYSVAFYMVEGSTSRDALAIRTVA
ncbi:MAG: uroporphyrinogen decarboxylase, partial [Alphaproteobacteria bacterium]|nr:uroporphyrinogen decarboxylase [Alphaproteobacteria bacterium]